MGEQKVKVADEEGLRAFSKRLLDDLKALEAMLEGGELIESGVRRIGAEQEVALVDNRWEPAPRALEILERIDDPHFTTELGLFNLEFNLDPIAWGGGCLRQMERDLQALLDQAYRAAHDTGCEIVLTGILPTLSKSDLTLDAMTPKPRYQALNDAVRKLRGEAFSFRISGRDELIVEHDNVMLEACNTSFQVHFQVDAAEFAQRYNVAQAVAGPLLACCANSPLLFGRELWRETRIALFQQSVDTRAPGDHLRDQAARVSFGRRWVDDSVLDIFREDVTRFRVLMSADVEGDPFADLAAGRAPDLKALRVHNSTVYRWNRACYGSSPGGRAHLRIENRMLPSGPTIADEVANAAFWFGLMNGVASEHPAIAGDMEFRVAEENFLAAARLGLGAKLTWPGAGEIAADTLALEILLPLARSGLEAGGIDPADAGHYLEIVEARVRSGRTGARWLLDSLAGMKTKSGRAEGLASLVAASTLRQVGGKPVHTWGLARVGEAGEVGHHFARVEQIMTTDVFTLGEEEPVEMAAQVMNWHDIHHLPIEDGEHRLAGVVTYRNLLERMGESGLARVAVREVMEREVETVTPSTPTLEAARLMAEKGVGCLPVLSEEGRLVGIVTERDFLDLTVRLLEGQDEG